MLVFLTRSDWKTWTNLGAEGDGERWREREGEGERWREVERGNEGIKGGPCRFNNSVKVLLSNDIMMSGPVN